MGFNSGFKGLRKLWQNEAKGNSLISISIRGIALHYDVLLYQRNL